MTFLYVEVLSKWERSLLSMSMMARFVADENRGEGSLHILLIATGSVASIKVPLIVHELLTVSPPSAR